MNILKIIQEARVHPMAVHAYSVGGGKYKVHAVGSKVEHVKAGETIRSSDLDDLTDAGHKVKEINKPMSEARNYPKSPTGMGHGADVHFNQQSQKMQAAIIMHLRSGKNYPEAVKAAGGHVKVAEETVDVSEGLGDRYTNKTIGDFSGLKTYAKKLGPKHIDYDDLMIAASHMAFGNTNHLTKHLKTLDTDVRDKVKEYMKEEVEQIDELSLETMKSAKQKLAGRAKNAAMDDNKYLARREANRALNIGAKIRRKERQAANEEIDLEEAVTVNKKNYSWGKMITVHHGASHSFPLHPEHQEAIAKLKNGESTSFTDETKSKVTAHRDGDMVHLSLRGSNTKTPVAMSHFNEESDHIGYNFGGQFKNPSEWENAAKKRGLVVKVSTHPSGEEIPYQIAKDKSGNHRGYFDHGTKSGRLTEEADINEANSHREVDDLKSKGKHHEAGVLAAKSSHDRLYGAHFGMRSGKEEAQRQFFKGYDSVKKTNEEADIDEALGTIKNMIAASKFGSSDVSAMRFGEKARKAEMAKVSTTKDIGYKVVDVGPGQKETVRMKHNWPAKKETNEAESSLSTNTLANYSIKASDASKHRNLPTSKVDNRYAGVSKVDKILAARDKKKVD